MLKNRRISIGFKMKDDQGCDDIGPTIETDFFQITVTANNRSAADELIRQLTAKKLVACAQIQGAEVDVTDNIDITWRCRFKTSGALLPHVRKEVDLFFAQEFHTFKSLPIVKGSQHFLEWLKNQLTH